ncbi:MAG: hypothetical protein WC413_02360 [Candidatus Nanoarchaeia archaeon]
MAELARDKIKEAELLHSELKTLIVKAEKEFEKGQPNTSNLTYLLKEIAKLIDYLRNEGYEIAPEDRWYKEKQAEMDKWTSELE